MSIQLYTFTGSPIEMGKQHGEALRQKIWELAVERIEIIISSCTSVKLEHIRQASESTLRSIKRYLPAVYLEAKGVAHGACVPLWYLVVAGGYSDIEHRACVLAGVKLPSPRNDCTIVLVRDSQGKSLLAGTWDSHATAINALVVVRRLPLNGPETLALSTAGWPMQQGLTSRGLGFAIANLVPKDSYNGITYIALLPHIATYGDALIAAEMAQQFRLCSGRYFAFVDCGGNTVGVETDGRRYWESNVPSTHTNHYCFPGATCHEGRKECQPDSEARRLTAQKRVACLRSIDTENLLSALWFHDESPNSVLQTGYGRDTRTGAAFVIDPTQGSLTVQSGAYSSPRKQLLLLLGKQV